jgi:hypothetical protein
LSWQTARMLDTVVMICVKFSFNVGDGEGERIGDGDDAGLLPVLRTTESTPWIA